MFLVACQNIINFPFMQAIGSKNLIKLTSGMVLFWIICASSFQVMRTDLELFL